MSGLASNNGLTSSNVDVRGAAPKQLVMPGTVEASQLALMLHRGAVAAAGYVIVMVAADAAISPRNVLPDLASALDVGPKPARHLEQSQARLHPEPLG
jgi:hypothetical protein